MTIRGWVYVITNKSMPGLVKVGYSTKDPSLRALELGGTWTPHPYVVAFDALVQEPRTVEQIAHKILAQYREGKEWFKCGVDTAAEAIQEAAKSFAPKSTTPDFKHVPVLEPPTDYSKMVCQYYGCGNPGHTSHRGNVWCEEHAREMRKYRFDVVRGYSKH